MDYESDLKKGMGRRIKLLRVSFNLSQAELAEKIGVSFQQLQKYESGKSEVTVTRLLSIAQALGVPPELIIGTHPSSVRAKEGSHGPAVISYDSDDGQEKIGVTVSPDEFELLLSLRKIKDKILWKRIMELIKVISLYFKEE
jgi:transcriptional regulator with XRE-family HTH domain